MRPNQGFIDGKKTVKISRRDTFVRFRKPTRQVPKYANKIAKTNAELYESLSQYNNGEIEIELDVLIKIFEVALGNQQTDIKNIEQIGLILKKEFGKILDDIFDVENEVLFLQDQKRALANAKLSNKQSEETNWEIDLGFMDLEAQIKALSDRFKKADSFNRLIDELYEKVEQLEEELHSISNTKIELMISILKDEIKTNQQAVNTIFYLELALDKKTPKPQETSQKSLEDVENICAEIEDCDSKILALSQAKVFYDLAQQNQEILAKKQAEKKALEDAKAQPSRKFTIKRSPAFF